MSKYKNKKIECSGVEYTLRDSLGSGGNGFVLSANVRNTPDEYAVKFLSAKEGDENYKTKSERFLAELHFCEITDHKNVLKVFGHGEFNGHLYYIMPRYSKTLNTVIKEEHDFFKLLDYAIQLCEAVKFIHDRGVFHRDIKPENVFIDNNSNLVLADFGIAHFVESTLTKPGDWLGNKSYAAPEQLIKGSTQRITSACDIYSVGTIINEMFTKTKPAGSSFLTISEITPLLSPLDSLVNRCMRQNATERPKIDEVLLEIKFIRGDISQNMESILDIFSTNDHFPDGEDAKIILNMSCKDLLAARHIFENASEDELKGYDPNYHSHIRYNVSSQLKNLYFQRRVLAMCIDKFNYEARVYSNGGQYTPLDLHNSQDFGIYKSFENILNRHTVENYTLDTQGQILKIFSSCCNYHCEELLCGVQKLEQFITELDNAPIIYIVHHLRNVLPADDVQKIDIVEHLMINWTHTTCMEVKTDMLYKTNRNDEKHILSLFENKWNATCNKLNTKYYSVKFKERSDYECFKTFALTLAKPYYVFEGDVLDIIRIKRECDGIIELEPWNSFDITNVLAKVLGLREDY